MAGWGEREERRTRDLLLVVSWKTPEEDVGAGEGKVEMGRWDGGVGVWGRLGIGGGEGQAKQRGTQGGGSRGLEMQKQVQGSWGFFIWKVPFRR